MIMQLVFNTHKFVKDLTEAGFTERQAEVLADEQVNLLNNNLATGTDIAEAESRLETHISEVKSGLETHINNVKSGLETQIIAVKSDLKTDIAQMETRLLKWIVGLMIGHAALTVTLIVKLTA